MNLHQSYRFCNTLLIHQSQLLRAFRQNYETSIERIYITRCVNQKIKEFFFFISENIDLSILIKYFFRNSRENNLKKRADEIGEIRTGPNT